MIANITQIIFVQFSISSKCAQLGTKVWPLFFDISVPPDYGAVMKQAQTHSKSGHPSLGRVLGAIIYDSLILFALFMIAGFIVIPVLGRPPTGQGEHLFFQVLLLVIAYLFFCWFWTHGGQTLGMRAWKIRLLNLNNETVTWSVATGRFCLAILSWLLLGLGYLSMLWDREGLSWHDRLSSTYLILMGKQKAQNNPGKDQSN